MTGGVRRGVAGALVGIGSVSIFNSAEAFTLSPYWLGGSVLIFGVLMLVLGIRMFRRAQIDEAISNSARYQAQRERYELLQERERERDEARRRKSGEDPGAPPDNA
ncbi:hypothetical protein KTU01_31320 [Kocuria turfanensis]|uniref:Uncharacterized protein n=1 Tax=Kocuria turfanensis TaxID=388357 RepID=A0A512IH15_9MICC|nr:hypothetical protein KTU01_31320 [Kocuria turfanensis]